MDSIFLTVLVMSGRASIVILAVVLCRLLLKRAPKVFSYALWLVVLFRLVCPFTLQSDFSIMPSASYTRIESYLSGEAETAAADTAAALTGNAADGQQPAFGLTDTAMTDGNAKKEAAFLSGHGFILKTAESVWLFGIVLLLCHSLFSFLKLQKKLSGAVRVDSNIYEADNLPTPFVLGVLRPKIYLPGGLSGEERDCVLAHEQ